MGPMQNPLLLQYSKGEHESTQNDCNTFNLEKILSSL